MFDYDIFEYFMKDFEKQLKGIAGESIIQLLLNSPQLGYRKILKNIYVPYGNQTTEIDVVMIHETGIYVIESKNYSGWIFGNENQKQWTQMLNSYTKKRFYNMGTFYQVPVIEFSCKDGLGSCIGRAERSSLALTKRRAMFCRLDGSA